MRRPVPCAVKASGWNRKLGCWLLWVVSGPRGFPSTLWARWPLLDLSAVVSEKDETIRSPLSTLGPSKTACIVVFR